MLPPIVLVDTWIVGDQIKDFDYKAYKQDGTLFDFNGYDGVLVGRSRDNRANKINTACTFPAIGVSRVASLGTLLTLTPGRRSEIYVCNFKWTRQADTKVLRSRPFSLAIQADPLTL